MSKEKRIVNIDVTLNVDAIRAAASNAASVQEMAIEVPVVDPKDLSIDDQIFGITLLPIDDKEKRGPNTALYTAVKPILVDTLSGRAKPGHITVNGLYDLPKDAGRVVKLEECYFASNNDAKEVCRIVTDVELTRSAERIEKEEKVRMFLQKQKDDDRF